MSGYCALVAFGGFSVTYFVPMLLGQLRDVPPPVHIHGFLFFCWITMFLVQSILIGRGHTTLHRRFGIVGVSLATAMVIFGLMVNLLSNEQRIAAGSLARAYSFGLGGWFAIIAFGTMFALAIKNVKRPELHKRFMLFATAMLLQPAAGRLYRPFAESWGTFLDYPTVFWVAWCTVDVVLVSCLIHDWRSMGRLHSVTLICGGVLLARELLPGPLSGLPVWRATYDTLLLLVA
jgi:hypothetical protein